MVDVIIIKDADEETIKRILNGKKTTPEQESEPEPQPDLPEVITKRGRPKKFVPFKGNHKVVWAKSELNILRHYYIKGDPDWKLLQQLLPNRTALAIKWKACQMKLCKKYSRVEKIKNKLEKIEKQDKPKKWSKWTKEEDDILRENYSKEGRIKISKIRKLMPHRTKGSIMVRACELKITNKNREYSKNKKQKKVDGRTHRVVPRYQIEAGLNAIEKYHNFVKQRSIGYQKQGYNEPDSRRMAITDWHRQKGHKQIKTEPSTIKATPEQKNAVVPENFPVFESISKDFQALIESITKHIIANKGTKLNYLNTKDILDISDGRAWHDFVAEFMTKSNQICEYFNVENKFKHIREQEKYDVIVYDG
jgi:hypothetical protein